MERFTKLFGSLIVFVYHCYDRDEVFGSIVVRMASFFPATSSSNATFPSTKSSSAVAKSDSGG